MKNNKWKSLDYNRQIELLYLSIVVVVMAILWTVAIRERLFLMALDVVIK